MSPWAMRDARTIQPCGPGGSIADEFHINTLVGGAWDVVGGNLGPDEQDRIELLRLHVGFPAVFGVPRFRSL
jgi:hypothetical protein